MLTEPLGQWSFTGVFGLLSLFAAWRAVVDRRRVLPLVGHVLHLVMAVAMVAMAWPWGSAMPVAPQVVVFGAAVVWFTGVGVAQVAGRLPRRMVGGHAPWHQFAHAVMMAAMVWMLVVMAAVPSAADGGHGHASMGTAAVLTGVGATAGLVVATVVLAVDAAQRGPHQLAGRGGTRVEAIAGAWMSGAMASMCWVMIAH